MDRYRAASNLSTALLTAALALAVFGLAFFIAIVYIG
jgi:hypothetical protein